MRLRDNFDRKLMKKFSADDLQIILKHSDKFKPIILTELSLKLVKDQHALSALCKEEY